MARILFHNPKVLVLDEISSSVDVAIEAKFYRACKERNILVLSIGHRDSLKAFHDEVIDLGNSAPQ